MKNAGTVQARPTKDTFIKHHPLARVTDNSARSNNTVEIIFKSTAGGREKVCPVLTKLDCSIAIPDTDIDEANFTGNALPRNCVTRKNTCRGRLR